MFRGSLLLCLYLPLSVYAQSFRGMCVTGINSAWVSGSKGTVLRTSDGGLHWDTLNPEGYERKDFRDIHAWSRKHAVIMSAGDTSVLLETRDGGKSWKLIYSDSMAGSFFDAIDVRRNQILLVGDHTRASNPYLVLLARNKKSVLFRNHFFRKQSTLWKMGNLNESGKDSFTFFAASGSNVQWMDRNRFMCIPVTPDSSYCLSGSFTRRHGLKYPDPSIKAEKYLFLDDFTRIPFPSQKAGGAYGFAMYSRKNGTAVGGSFYTPDSGSATCFITQNGGKTWLPSTTMPHGYRSGICGRQKGKIQVCTGPNGTDISRDFGHTWSQWLKEGYNTCAMKGKYLWLAGGKGKVKRMRIR
ncbi:MAG: hypothetical protein JNL57_13370 [Bacteroidetes bacterium]|nr:hypothetical protein [Bacteroidota bacterium]